MGAPSGGLRLSAEAVEEAVDVWEGIAQDFVVV